MSIDIRGTMGMTLVLLVNLAAVVGSYACFKFSSVSTAWRDFFWWQVAGNLAGFASVLTLTVMLRFMPQQIAYAINIGLGFALVQIIVAQFMFREAMPPIGWLGAGLVVVGIWMISSSMTGSRG
jgi:multidrug transporter EmrE-like cation transporter